MGRIRLDDIRRRELVDAAIRAVAENGLEKATVSVIAREAETSPGIVHHYFRDKTALLEAAMRALRAPLPGLFTAILLKQGAAAPDRLQALIDACFDETVFTPVTVSAWTAFASAAPHVRAFGRVRAAQRRRLVSTAAHALAGRVDDTYRAWYADVMAAAIDGVWFNAATVEGAADSRRAAAIVQTMLAGLAVAANENG